MLKFWIGQFWMYNVKQYKLTGEGMAVAHLLPTYIPYYNNANSVTKTLMIVAEVWANVTTGSL